MDDILRTKGANTNDGFLAPIPRHTHSMVFTFTNRDTKLVCFRFTMPVNKRRFSVSEWYRTTKLAVANSEGVPVHLIKGEHKVIESKLFNRFLFEWPGGISLNMPDDASPYDYRIVLAQLAVLKMKFGPSSS